MRLLPRRKNNAPVAVEPTKALELIEEQDSAVQMAPVAVADEAPASEQAPKPEQKEGAPVELDEVTRQFAWALRPADATAEEHVPKLKGPGGIRYKLGQLLNARKVTLSIDEDEIRVVVLQGREVLAWGTTRATHPELMGESDEEHGEDDVATRLRFLLKQLGARGCRVVSDIPLHAPLLRHLHLPKMRKQYLEQVVTSELLETIPFTAEEVDLSWYVRSNGTGHEVIAIASSKDMMDQRMSLLEEAGATPRAVYSKGVALAHAAGVADGVVVQIATTSAQLVLVRHMVPQAVHQVEIGGPQTSARERAEAVARAINEMLGYASTLESEAEGLDLPVFLTGQVPTDKAVAKEFYEALGFEVQAPELPMVFPEHFPPSDYATNLGLALADEVHRSRRAKASAQRLPAPNLLPARYLPQPLPVRQIAVFVAIALFGIVAFNTTGQVDALVAEQTALQGELTRLDGQVRLQRLNLAVQSGVQAESERALRLRGTLEAQLTGLEDHLDSLLERLNTLSGNALPTSVSLTSLGQLGNDFVMSGSASTYEDALVYTSALRKSGLFGGVSIIQTSSSTIDGEGGTAITSVSFQAKALFGAP